MLDPIVSLFYQGVLTIF